jgi:hypothetical protein
MARYCLFDSIRAGAVGMGLLGCHGGLNFAVARLASTRYLVFNSTLDFVLIALLVTIVDPPARGGRRPGTAGRGMNRERLPT